VSSRPTTTAAVGWSPADWSTLGQAGAAQRTPDLSTLVGAVVGRAGWASGNAVALHFTGTGRRTAEAFEGGASLAPLLHVEYSTSGGGPTNQPPTVNAGADATVTLPGSASLDGTVSDDGLPVPPGAVSTVWSRTSGPGTVTFADAAAVDTTASFSEAGSYVLRLTADDGQYAAFDEVTVTVQAAPGGGTNQPPTVSAGADAAVTLPGSVGLDGTVSDDGLPVPPGAVSTVWSRTSGPGTVTFADAAAVDTTASFSAAGSYVLRLTADDGQYAVFDEVTVTVQAAPGGGTVQTVERRVVAGSDDAEQRLSGATDLASTDLELTTDGTTQQVVGLRFANLAIPKGATITSAYVQFTTDEVSTGAVSLTIRAEASDSAPTYQATSGNLTSRTLGSASVPWTPADWSTVGAAGAAQRTPDLSAMVGEVVGRAGWASGNAVALQISVSGRRKAEAFEGGASVAPLLHVEYAVG
jgi:hypothetical protein